MEKITGTSALPETDTASAAMPVNEVDLPARQAQQCLVIRRIRRMDDPEVLERVLAGLMQMQ